MIYESLVPEHLENRIPQSCPVTGGPIWARHYQQVHQLLRDGSRVSACLWVKEQELIHIIPQQCICDCILRTSDVGRTQGKMEFSHEKWQASHKVH